ncbi:MAG: hypothetical protein FWE25_05355 [Lachnospiraceae bacterium]|nr:hypothetical protein [Lachnospiraceae bacterium]
MEETKLEQISKKDIVDYVTNMDIKKSGLGGLDKVDVYMHIQQIVKMYDAYTKHQLDEQKASIEGGFESKLEAKGAEVTAHYEGVLAEQKESLENQFKKDLESATSAKDSEIERLRSEITQLGFMKDQGMGNQSSQSGELDKLRRELEDNRFRARELESDLRQRNDYIRSLEEKAGMDKGNLAELSSYKEKVVRLQEEILDLKSAAQSRSFADREPTISFGSDSSDEINELNEELRSRDLKVAELKRMLRDVENQLLEKEKELEQGRASEDPTGQSLSTYSYTDDIGEILREARKEGQSIVENARREGQSIIDNARNEAEQEMIKALNVRAKYKIENEMYRSWCKTVEAEKRAIDEFLAQLSIQYKNVSRALGSVKEDVDSFDIGRIYSAVDVPKANVNEFDSDVAGDTI